MDQTAKTPALVQPSIRSFFQPRQPTYAAPPSTTTSTPPSAQDTSNNKPPAPAPQAASIPQPPPLPAQSRSAPPPAPQPKQPPPPPPPTLPPLLKPPTLPPPPSLPANATIAPITADHIPALRRINSLLLQITYPDSFYTTILTNPTSSLFSRVILWSDSPTSTPKVIGSIVCRLEPVPSSPCQSAIYIQSLTLLSPYRGLGLAAAALEHVVSTAALVNLDGTSGVDIGKIYAHVWTENEEGLRWYTSRGFRREGGQPVRGYYFKLRPDTAWVVSRGIGIMAGSTGQQEQNGEKEERGRGSVLAGAVNLPGFAAAEKDGQGEKMIGSGFEKKQPPPPQRPATTSSLSYQKTRPETEWNDLPADMVVAAASGNGPPKALQPQHLSAPASGASSRSSSSARRKKERAYPAAAFGS